MKVIADHCGLQRPGPDDHSAESATYGRVENFCLGREYRRARGVLLTKHPYKRDEGVATRGVVE